MEAQCWHSLKESASRPQSLLNHAQYQQQPSSPTHITSINTNTSYSTELETVTTLNGETSI